MTRVTTSGAWRGGGATDGQAGASSGEVTGAGESAIRGAAAAAGNEGETTSLSQGAAGGRFMPPSTLRQRTPATVKSIRNLRQRKNP